LIALLLPAQNPKLHDQWQKIQEDKHRKISLSRQTFWQKTFVKCSANREITGLSPVD
jgi:hypothetical protein